MGRNVIVNHNFLQMVYGNASIEIACMWNAISVKPVFWLAQPPLQMAQFGISCYNDGMA